MFAEKGIVFITAAEQRSIISNGVKTTKDHAPFTHSLTFLASKIKIEIPESIIDKLAEYTKFHIESRYPDEKRDFYQRCTQGFAHQKFAEIEEVYQWLIQKLQVSF